MTPVQESKLDRAYEAILRIEGKLEVHETIHKSLTNAIRANAKDIETNKLIQDDLVAKKNNLVGVSWIGAIIGFITGIWALIVSIKNHF